MKGLDRHNAMKRILLEEAERSGVSVDGIQGRSVRGEIVKARHAVWVRWSQELGMSLSEIGRKANRDHSTVRSALLKSGVNYTRGNTWGDPVFSAPAEAPRGWHLQA